MIPDPLYFESHINVTPFSRNKDKLFADLAKNFRMKITVMDQHDHLGDPRKKEYVITGHSQRYDLLEARVLDCVDVLTSSNFDVTRYKIEAALLDSRKDAIDAH